jgi:hypothetical protein
MSAGSKLTGLLMAGVLCLPIAGQADTPAAHRVHKAKKQQPPPPPLPSGTRGPVPQIPLDAIPAVAPQVSYQDGMLTIVAPNSTLGDILRGVRKQTAADIEIPANASERVATRLGPGSAREVVAELLNGSHFNYVLLGSPDDAKLLVRVVLVAKSGPDNPAPAAQAGNNASSAPAANAIAEAPEAEVVDEATDDTPPDQGTADAEQQQPVSPDQPGVKTPQQMLQEMQQRQLQMQQQQGQQNGQQPIYPPPGGVPMPQRPQPPPQEQQ